MKKYHYKKQRNNHSFIEKKKHMKILMYSIYAFDKPFIENATHGKLEIEYTNQALNEDTAN
jgi:hypothetical protein